MFGEINHPLYPRATVAEADAVAWVAGSKNAELQQYPFKFQALEPTEVRLKVLYTSICRSDIMHLRGYWGDQHYPCCPGHEIIGQITLTGSAVTNLKAGDKVGVSPTRFSDMSCRYCKMEHTQLCEKRILTYGFQFGGYCTHVQIDHNWAIKLPEGLDLKEAPPLLCAGVTVYAPLKRFNIIKGKCAVIGIGGLGHLSIQYANKLGMEVTAFTTRVQNTQSLRQLGASDVQHSTDPERLRQNAGKYDIVVSTLFIQDAELYKLHQRLLKKGGVYIMVGAPNTSFAYPIDNQYLVDNEITMAGSFIGSIKDVNDMLEFSAKYGIKSVNEHFSFEDFPKAFHRSELETPRYRCVINVTDWAKKNGFDK